MAGCLPPVLPSLHYGQGATGLIGKRETAFPTYHYYPRVLVQRLIQSRPIPVKIALANRLSTGKITLVFDHKQSDARGAELSTAPVTRGKFTGAASSQTTPRKGGGTFEANDQAWTLRVFTRHRQSSVIRLADVVLLI
jgi:hypothetical protein